LSGHQDEVWCVAFSSDGTRLLTSSMDATGQLWDAGSDQQLAILSGHQDKVTSVAFSPDGRLALVALANGQLWLWDGHGD
jgi:WD40 repeat protein